MTQYIKITDGVVVQKQPYAENGFIAAPDDVVCGMLFDGQEFSNPPLPPVTLPDLAPYQFRAMLALSGKQADLTAFIEALPEPNRTIARAKLEYSLTFKRDNDLVVGARAGLGLTDAEMDALWLQASAIV